MSGGIEVSGPDGSSFSFPAGTPSDTIKSALSKHYGAPSAASGPAHPTWDESRQTMVMQPGAAPTVDLPKPSFRERLGFPAPTPTPAGETPEAALARKAAGAGAGLQAAGQFAIGGLPAAAGTLAQGISGNPSWGDRAQRDVAGLQGVGMMLAGSEGAPPTLPKMPTPKFPSFAEAQKLVKSAPAALTGAGTKAALGDITGAVEPFAKEAIASKEATTGATVDMIQGSQKIAGEQTEQAIAATRAAAEPEIAKFKIERDTAAAEAQAATQHADQIAQSFEQAPPRDQTGSRMLGRLDAFATKLRETRKAVADKLYPTADAAMEERYSAGNPWQTSPSGSQFLTDLRGKLSLEKGTQITSEERSLIENQLLPNLEGRRIPGEAGGLKDTGEGLQITEGTEGELAYARPQPLRETLRKLRDAGGGHPEEGYAAIGQQRAGDLADSLAAALDPWAPELKIADDRYKELSEALNPTKTSLASRALATERFDYEALKADPSSIPPMYFKTPGGVRALEQATGGDTAAVEQDAANYAMRELSFKKTPEQARAWLDSNKEWLNDRVLPQAHRAVEQRVAQYEQTAARAKEATERAAEADKNYAARAEQFSRDVEEHRKGAAVSAAEAQKLEAGTREALAKYRAPLDQLVRNVQSGVIKPDALPGEIRGMLKSSDIPADVRDSMLAKLDQFDQIKSKEERTRAILKWIAVGVGAAEIPTALRHIFPGG